MASEKKPNPKDEYFPPKPEKKEDFLGPVSWLGGREFIASLKGIIIYAIYGQSKDPRLWMKSNIFPAIKEEGEVGKVVDPAEKVAEFWVGEAKKQWDWKRESFEVWDEYLKKNPLRQTTADDGEVWFDYIADSGDGQRAVYGVACLCLSDLWLNENDSEVTFSPKKSDTKVLLPRGAFLFIGGDTGYYVADYTTLHDRFQLPFRWAFASVRKYLFENYGVKESVNQLLTNSGILPKISNGTENEKWKNWDGTFPEPEKYWDTEPLRPLFGVPANHDYYDDIDGFNRQFRRPPFDNLQENRIYEGYKSGVPLKIPTFQREQEASYTVLRLPFEWWLFGIDSENEKLDFRQRIFFAELMKKFKPKKLILTTPEPTTVFGEKCKENDKTAGYLRDITEPLGLKQPFFENGELKPLEPSKEKDKNISPAPGDYCRLDLSGDVHHYARYWGPENSENPEGKDSASANYASVVSGGGGAFLHPSETLTGKGTERVCPQITFPTPDESHKRVAGGVFDLANIRNGGYVQVIGAIMALVIYVCLAYFADTRYFFHMVKHPSFTEIGIARFLAYLSIVIPIILLFVTGGLMHDHVAKLKEVRNNKKPDSGKKLEGRISELRIPVLLFLAGVGTYFLWTMFGFSIIGWVFGIRSGELQSAVESDYFNYIEILLLIGHFAISGLIVGLGIEYQNWVEIKYKYFGDGKYGPDDWFNLFGETFKIGFLESGNNFFSRLWLKYRIYSVKTVPVFLLNGLAVLILIIGISYYGKNNLGHIVMSLIFTVVLFGGFVGIIYFAVSSGAGRQNLAGKIGFGIIGTWHAVLQLLTPFVLVFYADWRLVIVILILTILFNGRCLDILTKGKFSNLGTWTMKLNRRGPLTVVWIIYGLFILITPFLLTKQQSIGDFLSYLWNGSNTSDEFRLISGVLSVLIVTYFGYRMSRVWFSWYLAVSLAFNGHNNEAGGAARIEDFKHILRIKVEKDKITVFVIGFDRAETELEKLKPKLIEKFSLIPKTFP